MEQSEDELSEFYQAFISGNLTEDPRRYFRSLQSAFVNTDKAGKIHILEIILSIIGGKTYNNICEDEDELINTFKRYIWSRKPTKPVSNQSQYSKIKATELTQIDTMIDWLDDILPPISEDTILATFYLFFSSYWQVLRESHPKVFTRLYSLHQKLLENVKYAKWNALDRINQNSFTSSYRRPPQ